MLVDADRHMQELVGAFLTDAGYATVSYTETNDAIEAARLNPPALIVAEILLPRLDGLALCRLAKADDALRATKFMILSVLFAQARAMQCGADAFMMKPIEKETLLKTVHDLIGEPAPGSGR